MKDENNNKIEASVFARVKKNSLSFSEIIELFKGLNYIKLLIIDFINHSMI